jgi:adenylyltransferase/sulfurtransferase
MDAIIGCLDNLQSRILLNRLCYRAGKTWIDGAIGDLEGQVSVYQPGTSCYECNLTDEEKSDFDKRISCAGIVRMNESAGRVATTPVSASIIAAVQVQEAMKLIHLNDEATQSLTSLTPFDKGINPLVNTPPLLEGAGGGFSTLAGKLFVYEGMHPAFDVYDFAAFDNNCTAHENWSPVIEIPELSADTKIHQALQIIKNRLGVQSVEINLRNNKFVDKIGSRITNTNFLPLLPESKIPDYINQSKELRDIQANEGFYRNSFENINETFQYLYFTLKQIGIPYFDVIQVTTENGVSYVELSKDKDKYERFIA